MLLNIENLRFLQSVQFWSLIGMVTFTILLAISTFYWNLAGIRIAENKGKKLAEDQKIQIDILNENIRNSANVTSKSITDTMKSIDANKLSKEIIKQRPRFGIMIYQSYIHTNRTKCKPLVDVYIVNAGGRRTHDFHLYNFVIMEDYSSVCFEDASKYLGDFAVGQGKKHRFNTDEIFPGTKRRFFVVMKLKYFDQTLNKEFSDIFYFKLNTGSRPDRFLEHDQKIDDAINLYLKSKNLPALNIL